MKTLLRHGWPSVPAVKPTYLARDGHEIIDPALDDDERRSSGPCPKERG